MPVLVVHVGHVRVGVPQSPVLMGMGVRLAWGIFGSVGMLMMLVVHVRVRVPHRLVGVLVLMAFREVQPNAHAHQAASHQQLNGDGFAKSSDRNHRAKEWSGREIGAGARRSEMSKRDDEQREADAIAEKADDARQQSIKSARHRSSGPKPKCETDRTGNQSLQFNNLQGIGQRNLPR